MIRARSRGCPGARYSGWCTSDRSSRPPALLARSKSALPASSPIRWSRASSGSPSCHERTISRLFRGKKAETFEGYAFASEHAYVRELSEENHFAHLDLLEAFRACVKEGPIAIDVYHPNERGHRCTAKAIADEVGRMHTAVKS